MILWAVLIMHWGAFLISEVLSECHAVRMMVFMEHLYKLTSSCGGRSQEVKPLKSFLASAVMLMKQLQADMDTKESEALNWLHSLVLMLMRW